MSAGKSHTAEQSFLEIVGPHIQDPENGLLIDHVFGPDGSRRNTPVFETRLVLIKNKLLAKRGRSSPSRDQICARAAGSALIGHSLGYPIEGMRIGMFHGEYASGIDFGPLDATDNMHLMLFREAAGLIAGFAAEDLLGMAHPCHSIQSRVRAAIICKQMGDPLGKPEWHFYHRSFQYCEAVVTENRHILNSLMFQLSRTEHIGQDDALSLLKDTRCISPDWFLYADGDAP